MLYIWDTFFLITWLLVTLLIVLKWRNWKGFFLAVGFFYIAGFVETFILNTFDPTRDSFWDALWIITGLLGGVLYVSFFFMVLGIIGFIKKRNSSHGKSRSK